MENKFPFFVLCLVGFCSYSLADPVIRCPAEFILHNDDTNEVIMDYREQKTCTEKGKTTCAVITYSFHLPCKGCLGEKASGKTYIPCVNKAEAMKWIGYFSSKDAIISAAPFDIQFIKSGYDFCDQHPCYDYQKPALGSLSCNNYAITKDDVTGDVIAEYEEEHSTEQCKHYQTKCYSAEIPFIDQETGRAATLYAGSCNDDYVWTDRYYPHASKNKNYCEEHGCHDFPAGCMCYGDNKLEGKGELSETLCDTDLCN